MESDKPGTIKIWLSEESLKGLTRTEQFYKYTEYLRDLMLHREPNYRPKEIRVCQQFLEPTECFVPIEMNLVKNQEAT